MPTTSGRSVGTSSRPITSGIIRGITATIRRTRSTFAMVCGRRATSAGAAIAAGLADGAAALLLRPRLRPLGTAVGAAQPPAGERTVGIDVHDRYHGSALEPVGHCQRIADELADADDMAVVPIELE